MKELGLHVAVVASVLLWTAPALAQPPVFYDDFDGDVLLPHWSQPPSWHWQHNVSNSMLQVTGLFFPSHPPISSNVANIVAPFPAQSDFWMEVWMGWEAGDQPHVLALLVRDELGLQTIAEIGYRHSPASGPQPQIFASAGVGQEVGMPAPPPGLHHFAISRNHAQFHFYFNGSHFASLTDTLGMATAGVGIHFRAPFPGQQGAFYVDRVVVVPAPSAAASTLILTLFPRRRRPR